MADINLTSCFRYTPGGKSFVAAETPFLRNFQSFIPIYKERVRQGDLWPGLVEDVLTYSPVRGKNLPKSMLFFDEATMSRVFLKAGFEIERVGLFARKDFPADIQLDGRESVGIIARKR